MSEMMLKLTLIS